MLLPATLSALLATLGSSGVYGKALIDPAKPVCSMNQPCSAPDGRDVLAFWRGGRRVAATTTRADGGFRVALAPGLYRITLPRRSTGMTSLSPVRFRVRSGAFVRLVLRVDVGIR